MNFSSHFISYFGFLKQVCHERCFPFKVEQKNVNFEFIFELV